MKSKASKIILYIVLAAVVAYLIYKAYTNYQSSGNIFTNAETDKRIGGTANPALRFRGISGKECLKMCPKCTWTSNGMCWPPVRPASSGIVRPASSVSFGG